MDALRIHILGRLCQDLLHPVEASESLGDLAANSHDLKDRGDQQAEVQRIGDEFAHRHSALNDHLSADRHHRNADHAHQQRPGHAQE